jgi:hypothetical protein
MQELTKEKIALAQLIDAIELYYSEKYISSITLAGAADEIFARLSDGMMSGKLGRSVKYNYADEVVDLLTFFDLSQETHELEKEQDKKHRENIRKDYLDNLNKERIEFKHSNLQNRTISVHPKVAAEKNISHAVVNFQMFKRYLPTEYPLIKRYCSEKGISGNEKY